MNSLGIDPLAGHLFLLYFAVMSALTPPVAVAAYAASAIADENPLKIAVTAVKLALAAFLVPFSFVFNPALLLQGSVIEIIGATLSVSAGLALMAVAVEGFYRIRLRRITRLLLAGAGILLLFVGPVYALAAAVLTLAAVGNQRFIAAGASARS